jgi:hypothetical protein
MYAHSGDPASLARFIAAARYQLSRVLPPSDDLSPHGMPRRGVKDAPRSPSAVLWLVGAGLLLILLTITLSVCCVEQALRAALAEISETSPALQRVTSR